MLFINCIDSNTDVIKECALLGISFFYEMVLFIMLGVAIFGSLLNSFALFIFTFSNNMTTKFLRYLKYYLVNSFVTTTNYMIMLSLILSLNGSVFGNQHKIYYPNSLSSYKFNIHYSYIFLPIWTVSYTFGSLLNIAIAYERILMYLTRFKFMRNTKLYVSLLIMLVLSCLINLPVNLSRQVYETTLNFSAVNQTTKVYRIDRRVFQYNTLFTVCLYISTFLRDIIVMVVELTVTIFLVTTIVKFNDNKKRALNLKQVNSKSTSDLIIFRKTYMNNSKISLYISLVSCCNHITTFLCLVSLYLVSSLYLTILTINGIILLTRHSFDFFLLLKLNKKFRRNVILLLPNCMKIKRKKKSNKVSKSFTSSTLNTDRENNVNNADIEKTTEKVSSNLKSNKHDKKIPKATTVASSSLNKIREDDVYNAGIAEVVITNMITSLHSHIAAKVSPASAAVTSSTLNGDKKDEADNMKNRKLNKSNRTQMYKVTSLHPIVTIKALPTSTDAKRINITREETNPRNLNVVYFDNKIIEETLL